MKAPNSRWTIIYTLASLGGGGIGWHFGSSYLIAGITSLTIFTVLHASCYLYTRYKHRPRETREPQK